MAIATRRVASSDHASSGAGIFTYFSASPSFLSGHTTEHAHISAVLSTTLRALFLLVDNVENDAFFFRETQRPLA